MSGAELRNIPPLWTALAHWSSCMLYILLLPRRRKPGQLILGGGALLGVLVAFVWVSDPWQGVAFNLAKAATALITLVPFVCLCRLRLTQAVYSCARAFIFGGFTASLAWQGYLYLYHYLHLAQGAWIEAAVQLPIYALLLCGMALLERRHREEMGEMPISPSTCVSTVVIAVSIYALSSLSWASVEMPFTGSTPADAHNLRTIVYLGGVAILYAIHLSLCEGHARGEVQALQSILEMQYTNYRTSQESIELVNRKYHDLKHQIAVLRSGLGTGPGTQERLEYLDRMEKEIRTFEAENKTGNEVLDTILTSKSLHCQRHDIQLTCVADGAALDFMDVMDLSTLFGNALDNAIESVVQLPDPKQRLIHLSVSCQKGFVRVKVENRCDESLALDNRLPRTTKPDAKNHGYGLKSICLLAEKYGGSATVHAAGGWFELRILIPRQEI